jgi:PPOX class probable F420-dependent enzyme
MNIPDSAKIVINSGHLGHFVTINPDGSPQVTCVWVRVDGEAIVIGKLAEDKKLANIRRDNRVSLSIEAEGNQYGMTNYVVVEGSATVTEGGAPELLHELAQIYVGPGTKFPPMDNPPAGFIIRITPTKIRGMGPWGTTF